MSRTKRKGAARAALLVAVLGLVGLTPAIARSSDGSPASERVGRWRTLDTPLSQKRWAEIDDKAVARTFRVNASSVSVSRALPVVADPYSVPGHPPTDTSYGVTVSTAPRLARTLANHIGYTRTEITDPSVFPYVAHGRLLSLFQAEQLQGSCSATIVPDDDNSLIITAGHCLYDPELGFPDAVAFAPGYRLGVAPFGFWNATSIAVTDQWAKGVDANNADPRYDIGLAEIATDTAGVPLGEAFGARGVAFGYDWRQEFTSFGYPAAKPFDGERLYSCASEVGEQDGSFGAPYPTGMGCDMTPGSSGGGWVIEDEMVNSVVSYSYPTIDDEEQFGPYFGNVAKTFYQSVAGADIPLPTPTATPTQEPPDTTPPLLTNVADRPDPFTPNGDGRKDFVKIFFMQSEIGTNSLKIFTKAGKRIAHSPPFDANANALYYYAWPGVKDSGRIAKPGRYKYVVTAKDLAGNARTAKGFVTIKG